MNLHSRSITPNRPPRPNINFSPDYRPDPVTASQWLEKWKCERCIWVPSSQGHFTHIDIINISPALADGNQCADFLIRSANTKEFFVCFSKGNRVFKPFSKPTLVIPTFGLNQSWWLLP